MISIIVCSQRPVVDVSYANNIRETIGTVSYELIWIDNSQNRFSIFEAYNKGVLLSKGDYLCFAHDDIVYHSNDWGEIVANAFSNDSKVGMLGLVGTHVLTSVSTCWWATNKCRGVLRQGIIQNGEYKTFQSCWTKKEDDDRFVVAIDGVWMVIRRELFKEIRFDQKTYQGFHFYDMDMSMQINTLGFKIMIVDGVDVEHKSNGNIDSSFYRNCCAFHSKWKHYLPVFSSKPKASEYEFYNVSWFKRELYHKIYFPLSAHLFVPTRFLAKNIAKLLYRNC